MKHHMRKALLPLALTSAPLTAVADLAPLDDAALGEMTGQAGVSIELETKITMGEFRYTDEGSVSIKDVTFGGANKSTFFGRNISSISPTDKLDDLRIDIDANANGDLLINIGAESTCIGCVGTSPVDFGLSFSSLDLLSADELTSSQIMSDFSMTGYFTSAYMQVRNSGGSGEINMKISFAVDDLDVKVPTMGMEIENMYIAGAGFHEDQELGFFDIANSGAIVRMNIKAEDVVTTSGTIEDALAIRLFGNTGTSAPVVFDMGIEALKLGGTSIGSIKIDDLALYDTQLHIYGH